MAIWKCEGISKDGQQYPNQNSPGPHGPYDNFGSDCVICGLTQEQVKGGSSQPPIKAIAIAAIAIVGVLVALGFGAYKLLSPTKPVPGDQAIEPSPTPIKSPISSPSDSPTSPTTVSPAPTVSLYPTLAAVPNVPQLNVRYGGSTSFAPLRSREIVAKIQQVHPKFILNYIEPIPPEKPGSGSGIKMLIAGELSVAQSSRSLKDKERAQNLEQIPVAIDGIAVYVNKKLSIPGLTVAQLGKIFTGEITNWKEVGGADLPIVPISRNPEDGGTPEFFQEKVMAKNAFAAAAQPYERDTTSAIQQVASTPGGIGYATASETCAQDSIEPMPLAKAENQTFVSPCIGENPNRTTNLADFANDAYPITRRLFVIIKRDGTLDEQAGVAYANLLLSDEGQQIVEDAGLVRFRVR